MDITKTKIVLEKINRLHSNIMADTAHISPIERDLLLSYVREFYDLLFWQNTPEVKPVAAKVIKEETPPVLAPKEEKKTPVFLFQEEDDELPPPPPVLKPVEQEKKKPVEEPPIIKKNVEPPVAPPIVEVKKEVPLEIIPPKVTPPPPPPPRPNFHPEYESLFEYKPSNELSHRLSESKIANLRLAMGLNERYEYINELFAGNVSAFEEHCEKLNSAGNFDAARLYIEQNIVAKFDWNNPDKLDLVKSYIKFVRRRWIEK